ncbi:hypothetical protein [Pseudomonas syringae]|jgi:hypothetical protein|uniref:Uncharacterized protein n=1 Tax=Pseudomonas syringae TaxID=317 RepID=A0A085V3B4_PSESX|nr:hypothetical protein [Pseudomonas syringae]KFE49927.1 hypothetical protein IV02_18210 [Pseudomonas syringae]
MDISLTAGSTLASTLRLNQSSQTLTAQPISEDQKSAFSNATPAAIYHPSEAAQALTQTTSTQPMVVVNTYGRPPSADFPAMAKLHQGAFYGLKSAFEEFKSALESTFPDLAEKKFGFTIEADGKLKALNPAGELSATDMDQLDKLLNASGSLKSAAGTYRDASIDLVAADGNWGGSYLGDYQLDEDNFASTIDLAALFIPKTNTLNPEAIAGWFSHQLWSKGELATPETHATILASRDATRQAQEKAEAAKA